MRKQLKLLKIFLLAGVILAVSSCVSKEECDLSPFILSVKINSPLVEQQPELAYGTNQYVFNVSADTPEATLKSLAPTFELSNNCTISPASGVPQDFSNGPVIYTVTHAGTGQSVVYGLRCVRNKHDGAEITSITIDYPKIVEAPAIPAEGASIDFTVSPDATPEELQVLAPVIEVSPGATLDPVSGTPRDFSQGPVTYTVTAESGKTTIYTITCTRIKYSESKIISVNIPFSKVAVQPDVTDGETALEFVVSEDATEDELKALTPEFVLSPGATIDPASGSEQDFSGEAVTYTVTSEDGASTVVYTLKCDRIKYSDSQILTYVLGDPDNILVEQPNVVPGAPSIKFNVKPEATAAQIAALVPTITVSPGATIDPKSSMAPAFVDGQAVTYTVTAENGDVSTYTVTCVRNKYTEAKILSYTFSGNAFVEADPAIPESDGSSIFVVKESASDADITALTPQITTSPGATIVSSADNFEAYKSITYTVTSEDGKATGKYTFVCRKAGKVAYDFEGTWEKKGFGKVYYQLPDWGNPSGTMSTLYLVSSKTIQPAGAFPSTRTADSRSGSYAMMLTTMTTGGASILGNKVPNLISGNVFLGSFAVDYNDNLKSTKFGIPFDYMPQKLTGYYKYKKGTEFFIGDDAATGVDGFSIVAILFEIEDEADHLDGHTLYTSDKIVAMTDPFISTDDKSVYTPFSMDFKYIRPYDFTKKYKVTIVMASSKEGDNFKGARGSELKVDDLELLYY